MVTSVVREPESKKVEQGFLWRYQYYNEDGKRVSIASKDINELQRKVEAKGLIWKKVIMDGGSKMDAKEVCGVVQNKLEDYEKRLDEIINAEEQDLNLAEKYRNYITCLSELNQQLVRLIGFMDHVIFGNITVKLWKT